MKIPRDPEPPSNEKNFRAWQVAELSAGVDSQQRNSMLVGRDNHPPEDKIAQAHVMSVTFWYLHWNVQGDGISFWRSDEFHVSGFGLGCFSPGGTQRGPLLYKFEQRPRYKGFHKTETPIHSTKYYIPYHEDPRKKALILGNPV